MPILEQFFVNYATPFIITHTHSLLWESAQSGQRVRCDHAITAVVVSSGDSCWIQPSLDTKLAIITTIGIFFMNNNSLQVKKIDELDSSLQMVSPLEPGIVCFDIDLMLKFYVDILGLVLKSDFIVPPVVGKAIHISPHGYRIVRLQTPYGERIKLIQSHVPPHRHPERDYVYECHGYAYLTFIVSNLKEILPRLREEKIAIVSDGVVEVRPGVLALFVNDPEGNFIEICNYPDIASYRPDLYYNTP